MKTRTVWKQKMNFEGTAGSNSLHMDTKKPFGDDQAPSPKELVAMAIAACTGMDVVGLLKKYKEPLDHFAVDTEIAVAEEHPTVFTKVKLSYRVGGKIDKEKLIEAVHLSQTKFCSISAMLAKAVPIVYDVFLNEEFVGEGRANFN
jgi:putative redox protein